MYNISVFRVIAISDCFGINIIDYSDEYKDLVKNFIFNILEFEFNSPENQKLDKDLYDINNFYKNGFFKLLIDKTGNIVGVFSTDIIDNEVIFKRFYLDKTIRGKGISQLLFNIVIDFAKSKNINKIKLIVDKNFERAISFYKKNKFVIEKEKKQVFIISKTI